MAAEADHVLLRPLNDVMRWAKLAKSDAAISTDDEQLRTLTLINRSAKALYREGDRALRRLTPLLVNVSPELSDYLKDLTLRNNDVNAQVRAIDTILYDFEDYIEFDTFEKSKFDDLQIATRDLAILLVDKITRFTTESVLDQPSTGFPPLSPSRPGSQLSTRPAGGVLTSVSAPSRLQRRPSQTTDSGPCLDSFSFGHSKKPLAHPPASPVSPASVPFSRQPRIPETDAKQDYFRPLHREPSQAEMLVIASQGLEIQNLTPPSSLVLSSSPVSHQSPRSFIIRDSAGYNFIESPPPSSFVSEHEYTERPAPSGNLDHISPESNYRTFSLNDHQNHKKYHYPVDGQRGQYGTFTHIQATGSSTQSSDGTALRACSVSSSMSKTTDSYSIRSTQGPRKPSDITSDSSLCIMGGLCKGARAFASGGPGRAIRKVGGSESVTGSKEKYSQEMLFGQMLATSTEPFSEPAAQCLNCEYKTPYPQLTLDMDKDPLVNQYARGIVYRSRFLFKSHLAVRGVNSIYFGCVFCDKAKSTCTEGDATVFQTVDLLFRHLSRHTRPLPHVTGVTVVYDNEVSSKGSQDFDLYIPESSPTVPLDLSADELEIIKALPSGRATKDHLRRRNEKPQARPDAVSEVLQFMAGANILGVEYPEKWKGKWCQGWHDGAFGTFPSKIIHLDLPSRANITSLERSPRSGVARWKFEAKKNPPGWLSFSKGDTIHNLAWDDPHAWLWSGSNSRGQTGYFPKSHIAIESIEDGSLQSTRRKRSGEKSRLASMFSKAK
ncbi:hypothetical protein FZEAL_3082 [Fusarium zealandicum]|uniref:SH3 domain-containing protein n=1 Tax=Fusarium zealandicum TaxID=1053134 RepID=A0A8H4UPJ2_9HYPO|nr:hypothetical protein FZEAL_3082 [Fusarium zealandicum]